MTLEQKLQFVEFLLKSIKNYKYVVFLESKLDYIYYKLSFLNTPQEITEFLAEMYQLYLEA